MRRSDDLLIGAEVTERLADFLEFYDDYLVDTEEIGIKPDDAERWLRAAVRSLKQRAQELRTKAGKAKNWRRHAAAKNGHHARAGR